MFPTDDYLASAVAETKRKKGMLPYSIFPYIAIPGSQIDACTYSYFDDPSLAKIADSSLKGTDNLEVFLSFCREHGYEAFWATRMNDTHDAADTEYYREMLKRNTFKQRHPELLVGTRERQPPFGRWSALDYSYPKVRERAFRTWDRICRSYDVDGIVLDFLRHLTFFRSTAWGGEASQKEREQMTGLLRRARRMMDERAVEKQHAILLAVRTPDSPGYCKALGLDIEGWMEEGLIDIWIATGYFRLQEWERTVEIGHRYDVPVWASLANPG